MQPVTFPEQNFTFKAPESLPECIDLNVHFTCAVDSEAEPIIISKWQPSLEDINNINNGGGVWLYVFGHGHPVVSLSTDNPFVNGQR